jgi:hypothetical protein
MRYKHLGFSCVLLFITITAISQTRQYLYYFDKDLNSTPKGKAVFNGIGMYENGLMKLILCNTSNKSLVLTEHFTDSTLEVREGLFQSYYKNVSIELEGDFVKGKEDGLWQQWDSLGIIMDSTVYNNGEKVMQATFEYHKNGTLESVIIDDFKTNMVARTLYDESGNVVSKTNLKATADEDKVFTRSEVEASFPGGPGAWTRYIQRQIEEHQDEFTELDYGTCKVRFIVSKSGKVSEVLALTMNGSKLSRVVVKAIEKGPDWIPAQQNGRYVNAYRIQPVSIINPR